MLSIRHGSTDFFVRVPPGVQPGQQFIVNVPRASPPLAAAAGASGGTLAGSTEAAGRLGTSRGGSAGAGAGAGAAGAAGAGVRSSGLRGARVPLPHDFLRPPGWAGERRVSGGGGVHGSARAHGVTLGGTHGGGVGGQGQTFDEGAAGGESECERV